LGNLFIMQFTPQQLSGGPKYSAKVKIGNWSEDRARVEVSSCRGLRGVRDRRVVLLPLREAGWRRVVF
jgi:hypothetical protein